MKGDGRMSSTYSEVITAARAGEGGSLVEVERSDAHAIVRLSDPERLNPLSARLTVQLHDRLSELAADPDVRAIVLTGSDPAFSAGGDLKLMLGDAQRMLHESPEGAADIWRWIRYQFGAIARLITRTDKAFIAAVNGPAAGVGLAFALACDILLLSERALIVPAFGRIGLVPEVGNSWYLSRRLGHQRAFGLFASGEHLTARQAFELGIGNELVAHEDLHPAATRWCERVERLPAHVLAMSKPLLRGAAEMSWEQAITMEEFAEPACFTTAAHTDGVSRVLAASQP
jgi:2-(1,2-epoxy-1,2-dihydrophenyl)acetyl-CoA isomerase